MKRAILILAILGLIAGIAGAEWKLNPYTNKQDYYEPNKDSVILPVIAATAATMTDGNTLYFGGFAGKAPSTTAGWHRIVMPRAGTIGNVFVEIYCATAGTNEAWTIYARKNNTTDYTIGTVSAATNSRSWGAYLGQKVSLYDYIEIKSVNPTWGTNPADCDFGGWITLQ